MNPAPDTPVSPEPADGYVTLTHVIYALHSLTLLTGLLTPVFIVTAFVTGWPSILAVILNYMKRSRVKGSYLESHFRWQIRTFWFAFMWIVVALLLAASLFGLPLAWLLVGIAGLWVLYRVARGWLRLLDREPMPI
jgi:uncharacterized membrane protein